LNEFCSLRLFFCCCRAINWRHRMALILQWNQMLFALTNRVIRLLYGPNEGTETISLQE
jgi:hypothetical protein